jgi:hypothetical protein
MTSFTNTDAIIHYNTNMFVYIYERKRERERDLFFYR